MQDHSIQPRNRQRPDLLTPVRADLGVGHSRLDPLYSTEGRHDRRWRPVVSVPERELRDWREYWAA
jgi:hypothetical protein